MLAPADLALQEASGLEHAHVLRGCRKRHRVRRCELTDAAGTLCERSQHRAPRGIRERVEDPVERCRIIFNHTV
jgi:hypothetical protein